MPSLTYQQFSNWLTSYGSAWEAKDVDDFTALFSADARYYKQPFGEPRRGRVEIANGFLKGVSSQRGIHFVADVQHIAGHRGTGTLEVLFRTGGHRCLGAGGWHPGGAI